MLASRRRLTTLAIGALLAASCSLIGHGAQAQAASNEPAPRTIRFNNAADFVVPPNVKTISVTAVGGSGSRGIADKESKTSLGGMGGTVVSPIPVTPGETLQVVIGRTGSSGTPPDALSRRFAGGVGVITHLADKSRWGAGGGGSAVLRNGQPLIVAGGGGGGGQAGFMGSTGKDFYTAGGNGGAGGGNPGTPLPNGCNHCPGKGGSDTTESGRGQDGISTSDPSGFLSALGGDGGAGGGGWRGGNAGNPGFLGIGGGGGAGGTSYSVNQNAQYDVAEKAGDGWVEFTYKPVYLATTGEITTAANPSLYGDNVLFTVTMAWNTAQGAGEAGPTGSIEFGTWDPATGEEVPVGTATVTPAGKAVFALPTTLPVGWTNVWASYAGDVIHSPFKTNYYQQQVIPVAVSFGIMPRTTDFGSVETGTTVYRDITVTNLAAAAWQPISGRSDNTAFAIHATNCVTRIAPAGSCTVTARFSPTVGGTVSGNLVLVSGNGGEAVIPLTGTGTGVAVEHFTLTPSTYDFGTRAVGSRTEITVTLTNDGALPVRFRYTSTDAPAFSQGAYTCTDVIQPNGTCTITFGFVPSAAGPFTGHLTVHTWSGKSVVFTGTGIGASPTPPTTAAPSTTAAPTTQLTGISPRNGFVGTMVTINGQGLDRVTMILFGGVPSPVFSCPSSTTCTAMAPGRGGPVAVQVVTPTALVSGGEATTFWYNNF